MKAPESQVMIRTARGPYVVLGGIPGVVLLFGVFVAVTKDATAWEGVAAVAVVLTAFLSWLATTRLELTSDAIHYRTLLVAKDVALSDIVRAEFVTGFHSTKPYQRLIISVRDARGERELTLNLGLFARPDIKRWMGVLNKRLSDRTSA